MGSSLQSQKEGEPLAGGMALAGTVVGDEEALHTRCTGGLYKGLEATPADPVCPREAHVAEDVDDHGEEASSSES